MSAASAASPPVPAGVGPSAATASAPAGAAAERYRQLLAERRERAAELARSDRRLSNARLATFAAGVALAVAVFFARALYVAWLAPPALVFVVLLFVHDRVIRRRERAERAVAFFEDRLARLAHDFAGRGEPGERFRDPHHPYAEDIDLFGRGSLFELLCAARTREGEERLAGWLRAPAEPAEVRARQDAVRELRERLDLREDLAVLGADVRAGLHAAMLRRWAEAPAAFSARGLPAAAAALSALSLGGLALWIATAAGPIPFLAALVLQGVFAQALRAPVARVANAVDLPARDLALLSELLERLERERPQSPRLGALRAALDAEGEPPSRRIGELRRLCELLDARRNQLFAPVAALLLWKTQCALALERWRVRFGPALERWLDAAAEIEALSSLAGFAFERPDACFPELVEGDGAAIEAEGLGHPLIPPERCVRNDVRLGGTLALLVVSGSNMSGKSTLLRSLGTAAVLAQAGAPVCATRLRLSPLQVGASLRIQDSLQEGTSRFYAELLRLRQVVDLAASGPTLFLLDEILHGTNSHDRAIGAEAVVRGLLARGAIGLVTTHDLALARVADALAPRAANVHFEDQVIGGRVEFDYRLRPGVVTRSNALELMRAVGLEVGDDGPGRAERDEGHARAGARETS
ncbi:MAG TPA: DNA mismatch repair protein MutS [Myxococcota bacterium]|nr:DNA mismatch repair protein MutS [Myxococcota bacterium]